MQRDTIKDKQYFESYLLQQEKRIQNFQEKLNAGAVANDRISIIEEKIYLIQWDVIIAMYSSGKSKDEIKTALIELMESEIKLSHLTENYVVFIWLLSWIILFDLEKKYLERLVFLVKRDHLQDYLVDFLIQSQIGDWKIHHSFLHPKPYQAFEEITTNPETALFRLQKYLEKEWYKGHNDCGWHDTHKSKENIYSGYWSFESAAIVKILKLDKSDLVQAKYFPVDLA